VRAARNSASLPLGLERLLDFLTAPKSLRGLARRPGNRVRPRLALFLHSLGFPFRFRAANFLREVPLMAFRILRTITPMAICRIRWGLKNPCACFPGTFEVLVHILHINVEVLRGLPEPLRVPITFGFTKYGARMSGPDGKTNHAAMRLAI